jgi:hypothetical protein
MSLFLVSRYRSQQHEARVQRKFLTRPFNVLCVHVIRYQLAQLIKVTCYALDVSGSISGRWVGDASLEWLCYS